MNHNIPKSEYFISVVAIAYNNITIVETYLKDVYLLLDQHFTDFEILLIDHLADLPKDDLDNLLHNIPSIRYIKLSHETPDDVALAAGLENAIGDYVVLHSMIDDPVTCIIDVIKKALEGYDIVIGVSKQNQTVGYKLTRPLIKWMLKHIGYDIPKNATGLRCLSRRAVNSVISTGRFHHQFYVRISKTGYPKTIYNYNQDNRVKFTRTLKKGVLQALHTMVFNSTKPLRWVSALGLLGSMMAFFFSVYSLIIRLFKDNIIEGWTTAVLFSSLLFMLLFIILAFIGEYMGRLLDDRSEQKDYNIACEKYSSVMLNRDRHNVLGQAIHNENKP